MIKGRNMKVGVRLNIMINVFHELSKQKSQEKEKNCIENKYINEIMFLG